MYAQFIITIVLIAAGFWALWKFVGKPIVERYGSDDKTSPLEAKKEELHTKEYQRDVVETEIEVTEDLTGVEQELSKDEARLQELDQAREDSGQSNPTTEQ